MTEEPKFTLEEARQLVARQECDTNGHSIVTDFEEVEGSEEQEPTTLQTVRCNRCDAIFEEVV